MSKGIVKYHEETVSIPLGGGTERRILAYSEEMMAVEVSFEKGARGTVHTHPHTQCSYVLSGVFSYSVEGEESILKPGDSVIVPGGSAHGTVCLEAGVLLDVFTPCRQDFLA